MSRPTETSATAGVQDDTNPDRTAARLIFAQSIIATSGIPAVDSAGVRASYLPIELVPPGVEVVEAWEPFAVVERVEHEDDRFRLHLVGGYAGGWCPRGEQIPVRMPEASL